MPFPTAQLVILPVCSPHSTHRFLMFIALLNKSNELLKNLLLGIVGYNCMGVKDDRITLAYVVFKVATL